MEQEKSKSASLRRMERRPHPKQVRPRNGSTQVSPLDLFVRRAINLHAFSSLMNVTEDQCGSDGHDSLFGGSDDERLEVENSIIASEETLVARKMAAREALKAELAELPQWDGLKSSAREAVRRPLVAIRSYLSLRSLFDASI